jgi:hypothetical protein
VTDVAVADTKPKSLLPPSSVIGEIDNSAFSEKGFDTLNHQIASYINDLVDESLKVSRRFQADTISAVHVRKASEHIATGSGTRTFKHVGTGGGILLGAGLSTVLSLVAGGHVSVLGLVTASGFSMVGAFLVAIHMAKD